MAHTLKRLLVALVTGATLLTGVAQAAPGNLDATFGDAGRKVIAVGPSDDSLGDLIRLPDGRFAAAGSAYNGTVSDIVVAMFTAAGALDPAFGTGGRVTTPIAAASAYGSSLAVDASNRFVVVGSASNGAAYNSIVAVRYLATGALDTSFGTGGVAFADFTVESSGYSVAIQADGRIVVSGYAGAAGALDFAVARFNADGTLDTGFNATGLRVDPIGTLQDVATRVLIQPDQKIVLAGYAQISPSQEVFALARYDATGQPDSAFGAGGFVMSGVNATGNGAVLQSDGKIVMSGHRFVFSACSPWCEDRVNVARFNADGTLDASTELPRLDGPGTGFDLNFSFAVNVHASGKIVVGVYNKDPLFVGKSGLARLNADLSLDTTFGAASAVPGSVLFNSFDGFTGAKGLVEDGGGKIWFVTTRAGVASEDLALSSVNATGALTSSSDIDFANGSEGAFHAVAVQPDGRIVAAGLAQFSPGFNVARFLPNGQPDPSFGVNGKATILAGPGTNGGAEAIAIQADGKIVLAGWTSNPGFTDVHVVRINADGTLDTAFGESGVSYVDVGGNGKAFAIALQGDGKIVVAGEKFGVADSQAFVFRLDTAGGLDLAFGTGGVTLVGGLGIAGFYAVAMQSDGMIVAAGYGDPFLSGADWLVARLDAGGVLDTTFGTNGVFLQDFLASSYANGLLVKPDGRILTVGTRGGTASAEGFIVQLTAAGALDPAFGTGGVSGGVFPGPDTFFTSVVPDGNGFVVAGYQQVFFGGSDAKPKSGTARPRAKAGTYDPYTIVARYLDNGTLDPAFTPAHVDLAPSGSRAFAIARQSDGRLVTAGQAFGVRTGTYAVARFQPGVSATVPTEPSGVVATVTGANTVQVVFTLPTSDGGSPYTQFEALSSPGGIVQSAPGTAFVFSGLTAGTTYTFTVRAFNGVGPSLPSAPSNAVTVYGPPAAALLGAGNGQSSAAGLPFASPLTVTVTDALGQPVPGIGVGFLAPPGPGATALLSSTVAVTNASGNASVTATANNMYGTYTVTPVVAGVSPPPFTLTNLGAGTQLAATQLGFGNRDVGTLSSSPPITVRNVGNVTLAIGAVSATGPGFSVTGTCAGASLAPNATCTVTARFQPAVEGQASGTIAFSTNAIAGPSSIILSGNGVDLSNPAGDADGDGIPNGVEASVNTDPRARDNDVFADARLFTMQQYRDFLNREGEPAGIEGWIAALNSGGADRPGVIDAFLSSDEFAGFVAPVVRLYFATFLRVPDYGGLTFNAGLVRAGTVTLAQLADYFTASPEFAATYGALDDPAFVTLLYANVLGRAPDPAGLAGWVGLLGSGYTRGQVLLGFSDSAEYQAAIANEVFVTMMYAGMLRRTPEPTGFNGWVGFLDAATFTRAQVINGFFLSTEYRGRFLP